MAAVWRCEGCKRPLGEVGDDGRLRWYDEAVSVAAGSQDPDGYGVRLVACRACGRVNPFRMPPARKPEAVDKTQDT